jgi:hypothetical protein
MKEREVKLGAPERFQLPDLGELRDGAVAAPRTEQRLSTVYFDTDDFDWLAGASASAIAPATAGR